MNGNSEQFRAKIDDLDDLLDIALSTYTPVSARAGLEGRIWARLAAAAQQPPRALWPAPLWNWAAGAALAAAVLLALVFFWPHTPAPQPELARNQVQPSPTGKGAPVNRTPPVIRHAAPFRHSALLPATAPDDQSLQFALLLANDPQAVASLAQAAGQQQQPIALEPIAADRLVIEPIEITRIDDNPAGSGGSL